MKKIYLFICLMVVMSGSTKEKYIWLSGPEGNKGLHTWGIYQQTITSSNGWILNYQLNNSITGIASKIYLDDIKPIEHEFEFVVIGHGMGGLIARSLQFYTPCIVSVITVGTPNMGSVLLKNVLSGRTYDYFSVAIRKSTAAIEKSFHPGIFGFSPLLTLAIPFESPINIYKNKIVNQVLNEAKLTYQAGMGYFALSYPCIRDMLPDSEFLKNLNSKTGTIPHINIYGAEDYWQVLRSVGSLSDIAEVKNQQNIDHCFDSTYVRKIQSGLTNINEIQLTHNLLYNALVLPALFTPGVWLMRELVLNARLDWDDVYRYLEVDMHADFVINMGAVEYREVNSPFLHPDNHSTGTNRKKYLPFMIENDGLYSSNDMLLPVKEKHKTVNIKVNGVNQYEIGNHFKMRNLLEEIIVNKNTLKNLAGK